MNKPRTPTLLLVAHGTRDPRGVATVGELAAALRTGGASVRVAFVDVLGPTVSEALAAAAGEVVLVPAFLAAGYHVRTDVPREVALSGHPAVRVTQALGPDAALARVQHARLLEAGWTPRDSVVVAAVGSKDPRAQADVATAAALLSAQLGTPVRHGFAGVAQPTTAQVIAALRAGGARRVVVSPYLLAPGQFHATLADVGADVVAAPLGVHPLLVDLVRQRYREMGGTVAAGA